MKVKLQFSDMHGTVTFDEAAKTVTIEPEFFQGYVRQTVAFASIEKEEGAAITKELLQVHQHDGALSVVSRAPVKKKGPTK